MEQTRSSQRQRVTGVSPRQGMSDLTVQVLGVVITLAVFWVVAFGINMLFTWMAASA